MLDALSNELTSPISTEDWKRLSKPTAVGVFITPSDKVIMVQPRKAHPNGWIFPQGEMSRCESPLQTVIRKAQEELGYPASIFDLAQANFIGKGATKGLQGKQYFVVSIPLLRWEKPKLNHENKQCCTVGGPGELSRKISGCSPKKKRLIQIALKVAIKEGILHTTRWKSEQADLLLSSA